jgi:hypothetical protein
MKQNLGDDFRFRAFGGLDSIVLVMSDVDMTNHPSKLAHATTKQMEKLRASIVGRRACATRAVGPADEMPPEYWQAVLNDPLAGAKPRTDGYSTRLLRLSEILNIF